MHRTPAPTRRARRTVFSFTRRYLRRIWRPCQRRPQNFFPHPLTRDVLFFLVQNLIVMSWSVAGRGDLIRRRQGRGDAPRVRERASQDRQARRGAPRGPDRPRQPGLGRRAAGADGERLRLGGPPRPQPGPRGARRPGPERVAEPARGRPNTSRPSSGPGRRGARPLVAARRYRAVRQVSGWRPVRRGGGGRRWSCPGSRTPRRPSPGPTRG